MNILPALCDKLNESMSATYDGVSIKVDLEKPKQLIITQDDNFLRIAYVIALKTDRIGVPIRRTRCVHHVDTIRPDFLDEIGVIIEAATNDYMDLFQ